MAATSDLSTTLINSRKEHSLELFKKRVNELSDIARNIPEEYRHEARSYFLQHCETVKNILDLKLDNTTSRESFNCSAEKALVDNTGEIFSQENEKRKGLKHQYQIRIQAKNTADISSENKGNFYDPKLPRSGKLTENVLVPGAGGMVQSYSAHGDVLRKTDTRTVNEQRSTKMKCQSENCETLNKTEVVEGEKEILPESFEDSLDSHVGIENGQSGNLFLKGSGKGQGNACDISKLLECIPELSQYMQVDPKNVRILEDDEETAENCLHLSVELDDGTIQEFKIAADHPDRHKETKDFTSAVDSSLSQEGLGSQDSLQQSEKIILKYSEKDEPSVMGRRLRTRKTRPEVKQRGPGRPKNENIPAPEINEKGETCYRCKECDATVKTYNALIVHMRTHTGSRPFLCPVCNKSFTTKGNMKAHEMTAHSDNKPWKCEYCGKCFKEKKVMKIHERIHTGEKPYSCSICEKSFSQKSVLVEHMLVHTDDKPHLCDYCGQGFRGLSSLKAHKKRHLGLREFQCESCDKAFVCRNELKRHLLTHTGERPFSCEFCSKSFTRLSYLKEHVNLHTGIKPFTCAECGASFSDTMSLHRHKKKHRTENDNMLVENESVSLMSSSFDNAPNSEMATIGEQTSIQVVVDENTSMEDFQKLQSLLISAAGNAELMMNSQDVSKQLYQVLCVNPDTQEVVSQVQGQEVIVEGQSEDLASLGLQYNVH